MNERTTQSFLFISLSSNLVFKSSSSKGMNERTNYTIISIYISVIKPGLQKLNFKRNDNRRIANNQISVFNLRQRDQTPDVATLVPKI
ncbi:hypothetical protein M6B38_271945 [Iris pallida]|uniref:Uncharacterized protein n=1 Tax=Iris pallida TaxID=29817 RepID=A0AAX6I7N6_IRIPA|nr:hypothetical protein M6B38_271945 [Iris pallida]